MMRLTLFAAAFLASTPALAQVPAPNAPAKELFGRKADAAPLEARAIGFYSKGCLAGGIALPVNGKTWQVMRLSRNRNWGHPDLIAFLERFAAKVPKVAGWNGILVGDLAQPRGGPMLTGHASHQVGLDADIWLTPSRIARWTRRSARRSRRS
jgi:penicillin-insensitive murein DD-endopeptidase